MKLKKINVDEWFPNEESYIQAKNNYIANYEVYVRGYSTGFFGWKDGYSENRPDEAKANWESSYPKGFEDWREQEGRTAYSDMKKMEVNINA